MQSPLPTAAPLPAMPMSRGGARRAACVLLAALAVCAVACLSPPPRPSTALREANRMSGKDWDRVAEQWLDDEDLEDEDTPMRRVRDPKTGKFVRDPKTGKVKREPRPDRAKQEMCFVKVETASKEATEKLAVQWQQLLQTNALKTMVYAIDEHKILFVVSEGGAAAVHRLREFVLEQPETLEFEFGSAKTVPEHRQKKEKSEKKKKKTKGKKGKKAPAAGKKKNKAEAKAEL